MCARKCVNSEAKLYNLTKEILCGKFVGFTQVTARVTIDFARDLGLLPVTRAVANLIPLVNTCTCMHFSQLEHLEHISHTHCMALQHSTAMNSMFLHQH